MNEQRLHVVRGAEVTWCGKYVFSPTGEGVLMHRDDDGETHDNDCRECVDARAEHSRELAAHGLIETEENDMNGKQYGVLCVNTGECASVFADSRTSALDKARQIISNRVGVADLALICFEKREEA